MQPTSVLDYYRSDAGRRFLLRQTSTLAITAIALCALLGDGRIDLAISRWFFDETRHAFPLTNQWFLKVVLHDAARTVGAVAALALLGLAVTSWLTKQPKHLHAQRQALLFTASACFAGAAAVEILKHFSVHACPWDLAPFGGTLTYRPLFGAAVASQAIHGCSPAAHPLVGYAWLGVGFALTPSARSTAWRTWTIAFVLGTCCGIVQIMRGAHFLSHVLWSAWTVWAVNVALLALWGYAPRRLLSLWQPRANAQCLLAKSLPAAIARTPAKIRRCSPRAAARRAALRRTRC
jgi:membrane-associated PAP2 superfamily phosphatase